MRVPNRGRFLFAVAALSGFALTSCVDAPAAPEGSGLGIAPFRLQPKLTLVAPRARVAGTAIADALSDAFDLVDTFRLIVSRAATGAVLLTAERTVTPGQDEYDLSVEASGVSQGEQLLVTVVALQGSTVLFESAPISVTVRTTSSSDPPAPLSVPLVYTGPGASAGAIEVGPASRIVAPGGTASFGATVTNTDGSVIAGVPVSWTTEAASVATVDRSGVASGVAEGLTRVTATIPTGLSASALVYVAAGEVAFERGGSVLVRDVAEGVESDRGAGERPAWSPGGADLFVSRGGTVTNASTGASLFEGTSPAVSPDQSKIAASASGSLVFANLDGSRPTVGPAGSSPAWLSPSTLVVDGGGVQSVRADGTGRTTLAGGSAMWPTASSGGSVAWVADGALIVDGGAPLMTGVDSRPTWSNNGLWLLASAAGELHLVPVDGSGPAVPIGATGTFPAWKRTGGASAAPSSLVLTGLQPENATPGGQVDILGSGFDWIIPANNRVFFPTPEGEEEAELITASESALTVRIPARLAAGTIRVTTFSEQATLAFTPALGSVAIHALTPWGAPVHDLQVRLTLASTLVANVRTDLDGKAVIADLADGTYSVAAVAPVGFLITSIAPTVTVAVGTATALDITVNALVQLLTLSPETPETTVGEAVEVSATAVDINGDEIPQFDQIQWVGLNQGVLASGNGLTGTLVGRWPSGSVGGSRFRIFINGQIFDRAATVRSHITGVVRKQSSTANTEAQMSAAATATQSVDVPEVGASVELLKDDVIIAQTSSGSAGTFRFDGLLAGTYVLRVANLSDEAIADPVTVGLHPGNPVGSASLLIRPKAPSAQGDLIAINDWNAWDSNRNPAALIQTLVATANNSGTKVVWWCGRQANPSGNSISTGICQSSISSDGSGQFQGTRDAITASDWGFSVDFQTPLQTIDGDVRVFWLWTPTEQLTNAEVNVLKAFASRGGRIIFNADYQPDWYTADHHENIATRLFGQLGTGITSVGTLISGNTGTAADPNHPIAQALAAQDITSMNFAAPGDFTVSASAVPIIVSGSSILVAYAPVTDVAPLPLTAPPASIRALAPPPPVRIKPPCLPGTVCGTSSSK